MFTVSQPFVKSKRTSPGISWDAARVGEKAVRR